MTPTLSKATKIIRDASREAFWTRRGKVINPEIFSEAARKILALNNEESAAVKRSVGDDPHFVKGASEDPRLLKAGYHVTASTRGWYWRAPDGESHDGFTSETAAAAAALRNLDSAS